MIESKYVNIDGYRLHFLDVGEGEPIVFVHGVPEWSATYAEVIGDLKHSFRCIVPDHLGFGLSEKQENADFSSKAHSKRLLQLISELKLTGIHLVTHDFGVPIGIGALIENPELFKSVTISNAWLWDLRGSLVSFGLRLLNGKIGDWLYLTAGFELHVMARTLFASRAAYKNWYRILLKSHQTRLDRLANYHLMNEMLKVGAYYDSLREQLQYLSMKGQFIWGVKDKLFTMSYLKKWAKEFPGYRIVEIIDSGHFPHMEAPDEYTRSLKSFLRDSTL